MTTAKPSVLRAFFALVGFSFRRQLRIRQVGWVAFALLFVVAGVVGLISYGPVGWRLETRERNFADLKDKTGDNPIRMSYSQYAEERLTLYEAFPGPPDHFAVKAAVFDSFRALLRDGPFLDDFAFIHYARWVVFTLFLAFLLPMLTLAYGCDAIGAEREGRTLLWLTTRPLPRWAVYVAKLCGSLPWCVAICLLGFGLVCLAGKENGTRAFRLYWPGILAASVAFGCLFHAIGALVRRPTIVAIGYVFVFEILVANLPGSLKQWSLSYYVRSLFYNRTLADVIWTQPESVDVYAPCETATAWVTLSIASLVLSAAGAIAFHRQEPSEEN